MDKCLLCNKRLKSNRALSLHIRKQHNISRYDYDKKFKLLCFCKVCNKEIYCGNKSKCCNKCRDRTGVNNSFYNKNHSEQVKEKLRVSSSENTKKLWKNETYRNKVIKGMSKLRSYEFKQQQSIRVKRWFKENPIQKQIRSQNMKRDWKNGIIISNNYSTNKSKQEKELYNLLLEYDTSLITDYTLHINNKWFFPDIISLKNKVIVEFFGNYWHCNPKYYNNNDIIHIGVTAKTIWEHDKKRSILFEKIGYKVFIVWEDDFLNNKQKVLNKLKQILHTNNESLHRNRRK